MQVPRCREWESRTGNQVTWLLFLVITKHCDTEQEFPIWIRRVWSTHLQRPWGYREASSYHPVNYLSFLKKHSCGFENWQFELLPEVLEISTEIKSPAIWRKQNANLSCPPETGPPASCSWTSRREKSNGGTNTSNTTWDLEARWQAGKQGWEWGREYKGHWDPLF